MDFSTLVSYLIPLVIMDAFMWGFSPPYWLSSVENCFQMPEPELVKSQHVD